MPTFLGGIQPVKSPTATAYSSRDPTVPVAPPMSPGDIIGARWSWFAFFLARGPSFQQSTFNDSDCERIHMLSYFDEGVYIDVGRFRFFFFFFFFLSFLFLTRLLSFVAVLDVKILVPGKSGLKVFLMKIGTPAETAGCMVFGWMTLAPK